MQAPQRSEHLFIVRVWQEPSHAAPAPWRGSVEHVAPGGGPKAYFVSLEELNRFLLERLGLGDPEPPAGA